MIIIKLTEAEQLSHLNKLAEELERAGIEFLDGNIISALIEKMPENDEEVVNADLIVNLTLKFTDKRHPPGSID